MTPADLAAYIGAAAWAPQVAVWIHRLATKPRVRVVPAPFAEISFTSYGPIFNARFACFAERRDVIIDNVELTLTHEDGETRTLQWAGLAETLSEITDAAGRKQIVSRDQTPTAVKIGTEAGLLEKFVRFQEPRYRQADEPNIRALVEQFTFLKRQNPEGFVDQTLATREFKAAVDGRKSLYWWKPGRYDVEIKMHSATPFRLEGQKFSFILTAHEEQRLRENLGVAERELTNLIRSNAPDFVTEPIVWVWSNVTLTKTTRE